MIRNTYAPTRMAHCLRGELEQEYMPPEEDRWSTHQNTTWGRKSRFLTLNYMA
jgi:hypothetical protein